MRFWSEASGKPPHVIQPHTPPLLHLHLGFCFNGEGDKAFGKRRKKTHTLCVRCGHHNFHLWKSHCTTCAFPATPKRKYKRSVKVIWRTTIGIGRMRFMLILLGVLNQTLKLELCRS